VTTLAVIVPSYLRPELLARCLESIARQVRAPDEVIVVGRTSDPHVAAVAASAPVTCRLVTLDGPGVLAAMIAGVRASSAEIVAFTDDDAVPPPHWTERIVAEFEANALLGGFGGRDRIIEPDGTPRAEPLAAHVGELRWYGRHVGNHHLGTGTARRVRFLKGVNSAYRREALGLPEGLRGGGAQVHFEIAAGHYANAHGFVLRYDPAHYVEHHPGPRQGPDQRDAPTSQAVRDASYNLVVALGAGRGLVRVVYAVVVGDRGSPGVLRAGFGLARGDRTTAGRLRASVSGTLAGGWALLRGRGITYVTFAGP
jgi:hypothetical protein